MDLILKNKLEQLDNALCLGHVFWWGFGLHVAYGTESFPFFIGISCLLFGIYYLLSGLGCIQKIRNHSTGYLMHPLTFPVGIIASLIILFCFLLAIQTREYSLPIALLPSLFLGNITGLIWAKRFSADPVRLHSVYLKSRNRKPATRD